MTSASILIKPSSANCNINCQYCFYKCLSSNREKFNLGFMSEDILEQLIKNAIEYTDNYLTFAFQGGEPTLAGLDFYKNAVKLQKQYSKSKPNLRIENTLQTNGILLNDEWAEFLSENNFLVGLSLDGPRKIHDNARLDTNGNGTFEKVMNAVSVLRKYNVDFNIISVITEESATKASAIYRFFKRNNFDYVQLIPCMDEETRQNSSVKKGEYAIKSESYGRFLNEYFDLWYEDFRNGIITDVRFFSNLAQMAIGYPPEECGMCGKCSCYFVVEGDGSVYPCDFYCTDEYKLGDVYTPFEELKNSIKARNFEDESVKKPKECLECKYYRLCKNGCKRFRKTDSEMFGINNYCEGYKLFFEHTYDRIFKLGRTIINPAERKNL